MTNRSGFNVKDLKMKRNEDKRLDLFFNKSLLRATVVCTYLGCFGCLIFTVKYIFLQYYAGSSFTYEDFWGLLASAFLFLMFFPLSTLLYFTNKIGRNFFICFRMEVQSKESSKAEET